MLTWALSELLAFSLFLPWANIPLPSACVSSFATTYILVLRALFHTEVNSRISFLVSTHCARGTLNHQMYKLCEARGVTAFWADSCFVLFWLSMLTSSRKGPFIHLPQRLSKKLHELHHYCVATQTSQPLQSHPPRKDEKTLLDRHCCFQLSHPAFSSWGQPLRQRKHQSRQ